MMILLRSPQYPILFLLIIIGLSPLLISCGAVDEPSLSGEEYRPVTIITHPPQDAILEDIAPEIKFLPITDSHRNHLADGYHVLIATDENFENIVKDSTYMSYDEVKFNRGGCQDFSCEEEDSLSSGYIREVRYYPRIYLAAGEYYFKVRAHYNAIECEEDQDFECQPRREGYSPYSPVYHFTTKRDTVYFSWPIIAELGPFTIGTYGPMMALGFIVGLILLRREYQRVGYKEDLAYNIVFAAIVGGVLGAKLFSFGESLVQNWDYTINNLGQTLFSGGGLTWYGGLLGGALAAMIVIYRSPYSFWNQVDLVSPMLALGYSFGRMGCQLSADGCFGVPTDGWYGMAYPEDIAHSNGHYVHPTPIYEILMNTAVFLILWFGFRKRNLPKGFVFSLYLVLSAIPRFFVEYIRRNPIVVGPDIGKIHSNLTDFSLWNMTISQLISVILFFLGSAAIVYLLSRKKTDTATA